MSRNPMITTLTMYNIDKTLFDDITLPVYTFPRSLEYDDLFLKDGWKVDKETFINNLLLETAELSILYTDPEFFKFAIKQWAHKEFPVWQSLYETLFYKYNPIWNKDGSIKRSANELRNLFESNTRNKFGNNNQTETDTHNISNTNNETSIYSDIENGTKNNNVDKTGNNIDIENNTTETKGKGNKTINENKTNTGNTQENNNKSGTVTESVAAFDAEAFANRNKTVTSDNNYNNKTDNNVEINNNIENENTNNSENKVNNKTNIINENEKADERNNINKNGNNINITTESNIENNNKTANGSDSENENTFNTNTGNIDNTENIREYGNIGITTTQKMIEEERNLVKFNIYDVIIDSFKARFCILLY